MNIVSGIHSGRYGTVPATVPFVTDSDPDLEPRMTPTCTFCCTDTNVADPDLKDPKLFAGSGLGMNLKQIFWNTITKAINLK